MANEEQKHETWIPIDSAPWNRRTSQRLAKSGLLRVKLMQMAEQVSRQRAGIAKATRRAHVLQEQVDMILADLKGRQ